MFNQHQVEKTAAAEPWGWALFKLWFKMTVQQNRDFWKSDGLISVS